MPMAAPALLSPDSLAARIVALMRGASLECAVRDPDEIARVAARLAPGTQVLVSALSRDTPERAVAVATQLRRAGLEPVPHVAARALPSFTAARAFLTRLAREAGVTQALLIAGDLERPAGPFASSLALLATGAFEAAGFRRIGIAGYPEGNPRIGDHALAQALRAKLELARRAGLEAFIVTQFCFEAERILEWIRCTRADGIDAPIRIGLTARTSARTLLKYALRCGVGPSIRALGSHAAAITRLFVESGPEPIVRALARDLHADDGVAGLHFFPFGGFARAAEWMQAVSEGRFRLDRDGFEIAP
jgi:methylenetetrahydrofolate reductase (NADPH)